MKSIIKKHAKTLILAGIIFVAIFLRFYQLGINPPSLDWDEASIGYNAYSILKTGKDEYGNYLPLSFRSFDDYKPPVYIYLTVPSIYFFGLNEFAVRFPAAFIGVLAVITIYFFTKEILEQWPERKESIALLSSFFLAISPWHLQFSRAAFEGNVGLFFLILSLFFFLKGLKKPNYYIFFAVIFILSLYSYHSFRLINPILLVILMILFYKRLIKQKVFFSISLLIIFLFSIPIYLNFILPQGSGSRLSMVTIFSDPTLQSQAAQKVAKAKANHDLVGQFINNRRFIFIPMIIKGYFDHFEFDFLFLHGDGGVQHHAYNMGMLYIWDFLFIVLGIFFVLKNLSRKTLLLLFILILAPLPSSITTGTPHPVRAISMIPAFQIFAAIGMTFSFLFFYKRNKYVSFVFLLITTFMLLLNVGYYLNQYFVETPIKYGYFWQYGNKQVIEYAKKHEKDYKKIIISYEYDQPYVYYLFYNSINPEWYQKNWDYSGNGSVDRFFRKIGNYEFEKIDFANIQTQKNVLVIGTPNEIPEHIKPDMIIRFPDGRIAYKIISL